MKKLLILLTLIITLKSQGQLVDTCSTPIFINYYGYGWSLEINPIKYNQEVEIVNNHGVFKIKIDTCLGHVHLSRYKSDSLLEKGVLNIQNNLAVDTIFIEDIDGNLETVPFYSFPAIKTGIWEYWKPTGYIRKEED